MSTGASASANSKELRESAQKLLSADYFAALGVSRTASAEEVKKAFIEAVKAWHPDRVPPGLEEVRPLFAKVFARLELARATVSDPTRRARYIDELAKPSTTASSSDISSAEASLEFKKAEGLLKKNDVVQAEHHARRALSLAPSNVDYAVLLVWLQAKPDASLDRVRELVSELDRLIERSKESERAYFYRAQLRKRLDLTRDAMADFARAAELNPNNVDAVREVRIHKMRQERGAPAGGAKKDAATDSDAGVGGFFRKLFKR
jgi:curved DNA-binding protein CbpA